MKIKYSMLALSSFLCVELVSAGTVLTSFSRADGFVSRSFANTSLTDADLTVTFSGGFQEQSFDGPAYNAGPEAYFFVNAGMGTFVGNFNRRPIASRTDIGTVSFNTGVNELSFYAADRGIGTPTFRLLDENGDLILSETISGTSNRDAGSFYDFDDSDLGGRLVRTIEFDNAGPAGMPPYAIAIDSFRASNATVVPEPSGVLLGCVALMGGVLRRRR